MRILLPSARRRARIEIIPLIDIVFFLLATFVMVSVSMVKNQAIRVNLPRAATAERPPEKAFTVVSVTEDGEIFFNRERASFSEMPGRFQALRAADPDPKVFIRGDEKAYFGTAIRLLDEARRQGITKVLIQTKPVAAPEEA